MVTGAKTAYDRYGDPLLDTARWRGVVRLLDKSLPNWRTRFGEMSRENPEILGDLVQSAILRLLNNPVNDTRTDPLYSQYETSYTKEVVDALEALTPYTSAIHNAVNLLRDYHRTQHEVYEKLAAMEERAVAAERRASIVEPTLVPLPVTYQEVRDEILKLLRIDRRVAIRVLEKFGVVRPVEIRPSQYKNVLAALRQARVDYFREKLTEAEGDLK